MKKVLQSLFACLAGFLVVMFFVIAVEAVNAQIWPPPAGLRHDDMAACRAYFLSLPTTALVIGVVGWFLAALCGPWIATRLGSNRRPAHGFVIGLLLLIAALSNMLMLPYPVWFWIAVCTLLPTGILVGALLPKPPVDHRAFPQGSV